MKFGLLYEIEAARPWGETSLADAFWEALDLGELIGREVMPYFDDRRASAAAS